jgi:thiosulfate reductase cytochrome b subunit
MKRIYLHPLPLRIWHWVNALTVILLLMTGIQFRVTGIAALWPHNSSFALHKWAGLALTASWVFWLVYGLASGHLSRHYVIREKDLGGIFGQMKYYLVSIFKGEQNPFRPSPEEKFNPLQKLAYGSVMVVLAPMMVLTGLLFVNAFFMRDQLLSWNAIKVIDALHVTGLYVFALFLVVHVYLATLGPTAFSHIKAMIVGYEEEPDEPGRDSETSTPDITEKRI